MIGPAEVCTVSVTPATIHEPKPYARHGIPAKKKRWRMRNSCIHSSVMFYYIMVNLVISSSQRIWTNPSWWPWVCQRICFQSQGLVEALWYSGTWWRERLLSWGRGSWHLVPASWSWTSQTGHWLQHCSAHKMMSRVAVYAGQDGRSKPQRQLDGNAYSEMYLGKAQASKNSYGPFAEFLSLPCRFKSL